MFAGGSPQPFGGRTIGDPPRGLPQTGWGDEDMGLHPSRRSRRLAPRMARLALVLAAAPSMAQATTTTSAPSGSFGDLPPPEKTAAPLFESMQRLELEIVVNGLRTELVAGVEVDEGRYRLRAADLRSAGLSFGTAGDIVDLAELDGVRADYDAPQQRLYLSVTPEYLPTQRIDRRKRKVAKVDYDMGALLNYDVYVSGGEGKLRASLFHEARFFSRAGVVSTSGALRSGRERSYVRYDTSFRRSDEATATTIEVGDFITRTLPWAPAVRLGGIQVSRDFSVRPDIITYPLPEFKGSAALPSAIELVVGGQRIAGAQVDPGPFAIETLPPINGYGEANLIVTDMHGRTVEQSLPFYVSSALLQPGLTDFAVAFGAFREHYGIRNFDYGGVAAAASARHGVSNTVTLEVRAEIADDMSLAGGGAVIRLGKAGTLSGSYSRSFRSDAKGGDGSQMTLGYDYQARGFAIGLRHSRRSGGFTDLGLLDRRSLGEELVTAATLSLSLGPAGTLGLGYFDIRREIGADSRLANASWSMPFWSRSRLHASASRAFADDNWSGTLTLAIPLGGRGGTLAGGLAARTGEDMVWRADYSRAVPVAGGLGWSAGLVQDGGGLDWRGDMTWRTGPVQLRAGAYGASDATAWFGASGALVLLDDALFAANRVADAFAVVNTGAPGIPVRYENQLIGTTNGHGRLLIPSASGWYAAKYEIDPLGLPADVKVGAVEQRVAVAGGSGRVVRFEVDRLRPARAVLRGDAGAFIPAGSAASLDGAAPTVIGWDGLLFLDTIGEGDAERTIRVDRPDGSRCTARFRVPARGVGEARRHSRADKVSEDFAAADHAPPVIDLGELSCRS
jgi:outer membrane usher protein